MGVKLEFPPGPRSWVPGGVFRELRRGPLEFLTGMGKKFGDIWSFSAFGVRYVVVNHPDLVKEVLQAQAEAFWKGPALQNSKGILGEGLLTAEGEGHRMQRRLMTPAFHAKQVENYAGVVRECASWRRTESISALPASALSPGRQGPSKRRTGPRRWRRPKSRRPT